MRLTKWIESLYKPQETNFRDAALEDLQQALNEPAVRVHWINAIIEELRAINVGVDRALRENRVDQLPSKSDRRQALVFCLNQILDSKQALDTERFEQERDLAAKSGPWESVAVQQS